MSIILVAEAFKRTFGSTSRKMIAVRLADHASDDGSGIYPGIDRLVAECELSRRTVITILRQFEDEGLLVRRVKGGHRRGAVAVYDMDVDRLHSYSPAIEKNKGATIAPTPEKVGAAIAPTAEKVGATDDRTGCNHCTLTLKEPSEDPLTPIEAEPEAEPVDLFDQAIALFPDPQTQDRKRARNQWDQLDWRDRRRALEHVPQFLASIKGSGKKRAIFWRYLQNRPWRLPVRKTQDGKVYLERFSVDWMRLRFELLEAGPGSLDGRDGYAEVRRMDQLAEQHRTGKLAPDGWVPPDRQFEPVPVGSDLFCRWQEHFARRRWPWIPDPGTLPVVHFPAGGPPDTAPAGDDEDQLEGISWAAE